MYRILIGEELGQLRENRASAVFSGSVSLAAVVLVVIERGQFPVVLGNCSTQQTAAIEVLVGSRFGW